MTDGTDRKQGQRGTDEEKTQETKRTLPTGGELPDGREDQIPDSEPEYSFIQQEVVNRRKNARLKRMALAVAFTVLLAIIFGLVSFFTIIVTDGIYQNRLEKDRLHVQLGSEESTEEPTTEPETTESTALSTEETTEPETVSPEEEALSGIASYYDALYDVAEQVNTSIVTVTGVTNGMDWFLNPSQQMSSTSGLIMAENGEELLILTEYDEVAEANEIRVTFRNALTVVGEFYDGDRELGIALVAVPLAEIPTETAGTYQIAQLGNSYDLDTGTPVLALGNPNGYAYSMLFGTVTNRRSEQVITDNKVELFNTSLPVLSNGEGVITDLDGQVVGLMSHRFNKDLNKNISTCLSISRLRTILEDMANREERPYLGVIGSELTSEAAASLGTGSGIYVTEIATESPAFEAGILRGDIITQIDEMPVINFINLQTALRNAGVGKSITITVVRTTKTSDNVITLKAELTKRN